MTHEAHSILAGIRMPNTYRSAAGRIGASEAALGRRSRVGSSVGMTLIEVLVSIGVIALLMTTAMIGTGAVKNSRLRGAATMITGAIRVAYTRSSATSRSLRLVLDLKDRSVWLEESNESVAVKSGDTTGGAAAATEAEKDAVEQASKILKGPRVPRPAFKPIKAFGATDTGEDGHRTLGSGIQIRQVFTGHTPDGQSEGRAYLFFWPGGQTERAAIQLQKEGAGPDEGLTILVSPLTGKARIVSGIQPMDPLRDDGTSSEREDRAF